MDKAEVVGVTNNNMKKASLHGEHFSERRLFTDLDSGKY